MVDKRCKTCIYQTTLSSGKYQKRETACYYNVIMGEMRKCPSGSECDKYVCGKMVRQNSRGCFLTKRIREDESVKDDDIGGDNAERCS